VEVFLPYFELHHCALNTNLKERKYAKRAELIRKLNRFTAYNPNFGRKYKEPRYRGKQTTGFFQTNGGDKPLFNMSHIGFHEYYDMSRSHISIQRIQNKVSYNNLNLSQIDEYELGGDLLRNIVEHRTFNDSDEEEEGDDEEQEQEEEPPTFVRRVPTPTASTLFEDQDQDQDQANYPLSHYNMSFDMISNNNNRTIPVIPGFYETFINSYQNEYNEYNGDEEDGIDSMS
jgi:hypothetical protein